MSIKLINHNYELIVSSFENRIYIKITNLITWTAFESNIYSYDIVYECVRTIENLLNIFVKGFQIMDKFNVDILNPDIKIFNNDDYIVLKLLERHNDIILTIYYNLAMNFKFNINFKKIQDSNSNCNLVKLQSELEYKNKEIIELQIKLNDKDAQLNELQIKLNEDTQLNEDTMNALNNINVSIGKYCWWSEEKIVYCKSNIEILNVSSITLNTKLTELYKLKRLIFRGDEEIINSTLEELIIDGRKSSSTGYQAYYFTIPNLSGIPRLKRLEFNKCHNINTYDYNHSISCLIHSIKHHPNCSNIDLVFSDNYNYNKYPSQAGGNIMNGIFVSQYEKFLNLGLKSVTIY